MHQITNIRFCAYIRLVLLYTHSSILFKETFPQRIFTTIMTVTATDTMRIAANTIPPIMAAVLVESEAAESVGAEVVSVVVSVLQ